MNNLKQKLLMGSAFLIGVLIIFCLAGSVKNLTADKNASDRYNPVLLGEKNNLEKEGRILEKQGRFDEAIVKYRGAVELDKRIYGSDKGRPLAFIAEVYQKQGKYNQALEVLKGLLEFHPQHQPYIEWEQELNVLIQSEKENSTKPIYQYIEQLKKKYADRLPPIGYTFGSVDQICTILNLYDTIGDQDAGIAYIDVCLKFFRDRKEAQGEKFVPGHNYNEFLKVREAFEQDKRDGTKGRATKALIQSDYFPW